MIQPFQPTADPQTVLPEVELAGLLPDYKLLRRIGGGSYGVVWLARNVFGERRAVKVISRSRFSDERPFEREFEGIQRFEPISRSHPSQLAILHVGKDDGAGCFYYVMELADAAKPPVVSNQGQVISESVTSESVTEVAGGSLNTDLLNTDLLNTDLLNTDYRPHTLRHDLEQRGRLPIPDCVQIGLSLTTALAHLHKHGLVHRDIKPSNVIFVNGVPKLGDIGLVTEAGDTQSIVGTEGYIPPEGPGTPQADLFSLGKVLYEISAGMDRRRFPELPKDLRSWPDSRAVVELNEILLKACAKDLDRRYQSAEEMRRELALLQHGNSVSRWRAIQRCERFATKSVLFTSLFGCVLAVWLLARRSGDKPLDPLTTGKNVGGYPPTTMRGTTNLEAWIHYKRAESAMQRPTGEGTVSPHDEFKEAIRLDPNFALAYGGLYRSRFGDTWDLTHTKSPDYFRWLAAKMVELDNGLAETHMVLGKIKFWEWNWVDAEREFGQALALNPNCVLASGNYGLYLACMGRSRKALEVLEHGRQVDPTHPQIVKIMGHAYFVNRSFSNALAYYRESCKIGHNFADGHLRAFYALVGLKDFRAAIKELETYQVKWGEIPTQAKQQCDELRRAFEISGENGFWQKRLEQVRAVKNPDDEPYAFAEIYARLGDAAGTFKYLDKAYDRHDELVYLIFDECWDRWRDAPQFQRVIHKVGLANYEKVWREQLRDYGAPEQQRASAAR